MTTFVEDEVNWNEYLSRLKIWSSWIMLCGGGYVIKQKMVCGDPMWK